MANIDPMLQQLYASIFERYDEDGNRRLDHAEFAQLCRARIPGVSEVEIEAVFKDLDTDRSGVIELDEFLKVAPRLLRKR